MVGALVGATIGGGLGVVGGSLITAAILAALGGVGGAAVAVAWALRRGTGSRRDRVGSLAQVTPTSAAILDDVSGFDRAALVVALDGPASSGKSSVGAAAALALGYRFCDTGLLYRAATWLALRRGVRAEGNPAALVALVREIALVPDANGRLAHVTVEGEDVTDDVHTPSVDEAVSAISSVAELRAALLDRQRALAAEPGGIVMAGRDIGTVVLPDADLKVFLDASAEERARRRTVERGIDPDGPEARAILDQLRRRDELDRNRPVAPLRPAADAIHIVTDGNELEETVAAVVAAIRAAERKRATPTVVSE
jgi:cytidylate kinase